MPRSVNPHKGSEAVSLYEVETDLYHAMEDWLKLKEYTEELEQEAQKPGIQVEPQELEEALTQLDEQQRKLYAVIRAYTDGAKDKRDSLARYFLVLKAAESNIADEAARLRKRRKAAQRRLERLCSYLDYIMVTTGQERLQGLVFRIRRQRNQASVEITDEMSVPEQWLKPPVRPEPDLTRIKDALMIEASKAAQRYRQEVLEQEGEEIEVKPEEMGAILEMVQEHDAANTLKIEGVRLVTNSYHIRVE